MFAEQNRLSAKCVIAGFHIEVTAWKFDPEHVSLEIDYECLSGTLARKVNGDDGYCVDQEYIVPTTDAQFMKIDEEGTTLRDSTQECKSLRITPSSARITTVQLYVTNRRAHPYHVVEEEVLQISQASLKPFVNGRELASVSGDGAEVLKLPARIGMEFHGCAIPGAYGRLHLVGS